jgi:hypothetical protein
MGGKRAEGDAVGYTERDYDTHEAHRKQRVC